jgi:hypothetical protein
MLYVHMWHVGLSTPDTCTHTLVYVSVWLCMAIPTLYTYVMYTLCSSSLCYGYAMQALYYIGTVC